MTSSLQPADAADLAVGRGAEDRRRRTFKAARIAPYVFVLPALILFIGFLLIPIVYATWLSFRANRRSGGGILGQQSETFVGFENYVRSLTDPLLYDALGRMLIYGAIVIPTMLGLAPVSYTHLRAHETDSY